MSCLPRHSSVAGATRLARAMVRLRTACQIPWGSQVCEPGVLCMGRYRMKRKPWQRDFVRQYINKRHF